MNIQKRLVAMGYPDLYRGYTLGDLIQLLPMKFNGQLLEIRTSYTKTWIISYGTILAESLEETCCLMLEKIHSYENRN